MTGGEPVMPDKVTGSITWLRVDSRGRQGVPERRSVGQATIWEKDGMIHLQDYRGRLEDA
jgi:hypothetical protein